MIAITSVTGKNFKIRITSSLVLINIPELSARFRLAKSNLSFYSDVTDSHKRLIALATQPAPNPLSIFTTLTFDAQLFSIASNAVNPPKLAP